MSAQGTKQKKRSGAKKRVATEGGCFCGLVRYRVMGAPLFVVNCHCVMCRKASGAPYVTWVTHNAKDLKFTKMLPMHFESSSKAERSFCDQCGTPITFQYKARRKFIDVTVGSLDEPEKFSPRCDIYTASHISWVPLDDALEHHDADLDSSDGG